MSRLPWFEAAPAEAVVTFGTRHMQTTLIFLNRSLTAGTMFGDELGQVLALSFHSHPLVKPSIVHPLRHVTAAGRIMSLRKAAVKAGNPGALSAGGSGPESFLTKDAVTALRVCAPSQIGAAFHKTTK